MVWSAAWRHAGAMMHGTLAAAVTAHAWRSEAAVQPRGANTTAAHMRCDVLPTPTRLCMQATGLHALRQQKPIGRPSASKPMLHGPSWQQTARLHAHDSTSSLVCCPGMPGHFRMTLCCIETLDAVLLACAAGNTFCRTAYHRALPLVHPTPEHNGGHI